MGPVHRRRDRSPQSLSRVGPTQAAAPLGSVHRLPMQRCSPFRKCSQAGVPTLVPFPEFQEELWPMATASVSVRRGCWVVGCSLQFSTWCPGFPKCAPSSSARAGGGPAACMHMGLWAFVSFLPRWCRQCFPGLSCHLPGLRGRPTLACLLYIFWRSSVVGALWCLGACTCSAYKPVEWLLLSLFPIVPDSRLPGLPRDPLAALYGS